MKLSKNMRNCMGRAAAAVLCAAMVLPMLPAIPAYAVGQPEMHVHTQECFEQSRGALKCGKAHEHTDSCYEIAYGDIICGLEGLPVDLIPLAGSATDADNVLGWRASLDGETDPVKRAAIAAAGMPGEASGSDIETVNSVLDAAGIPGSQLARYDTVEAWDKAYKHTQLNRNDNGKTGLPKAGDIVFFNDNKDGTQAATRMGVVAFVNSQDKSVTVTVSNGSSAETVHIGTAQACWYLDMAAACLGMTGVSDNSQNGDRNNDEADTQEPGQDGTPGNGDDNNNDDNQGQDNGENSDNEFRCKLGLVEHVHDKSCYENTTGGEAGALTCGKQEHVHTADCLEGTEVRTDGDKVIYKDGKIYKVTYDEDGNEVLTEIADADVRSNGDVYDADGNFVGNLFDTDGDGILSKEELEAASEIFDKLINKIEEAAPAAKVAAKAMRMAMANGLNNGPRQLQLGETFDGYANTSVYDRQYKTKYRLVDTSKFVTLNLYNYSQTINHDKPDWVPRFNSDPGPSEKFIRELRNIWGGVNFGDYILVDGFPDRGPNVGIRPTINQIAKFGYAGISGVKPDRNGDMDNIPLGPFKEYLDGVLTLAPNGNKYPGMQGRVQETDGEKDYGHAMLEYLFPGEVATLDESYYHSAPGIYNTAGYDENGNFYSDAFKSGTNIEGFSGTRRVNKPGVSGLLAQDCYNPNHYVFDSTLLHAQWSAKDNAFKLYDAVITPNMQPYSYGNFMPFNDIETQATRVADISYSYMYDKTNTCNPNTVIGRLTNLTDTKDFFFHSPDETRRTKDYIISLLKIGHDVLFDKNAEFPLILNNFTDSTGVRWNSSKWLSASPYERMRVVNENKQKNGLGKIVNPKLEASPDRLYNIDYDVPKDFHFGMDMTLSFVQSAEGMSNRAPLEFAFTGDDDVIVYIDDVKFLDLSGIHNAVAGEIDLHNGLVRYYTTLDTGVWTAYRTPRPNEHSAEGVTGNIVNRFGGRSYTHNGRTPSIVFTFETVLQRAGYTEKTTRYIQGAVIGNAALGGETVATFKNPTTGDTIEMTEIPLENTTLKSYRPRDFTEHNLNFYFLERGAGSSLCQIDFTLPLLNTNDLTITKEVAANNDTTAEALLGNPDFLFQVYTWPKGTEYAECVNSKDSATLLTGVEYDILDADGDKLNADPRYIGDDGIIPIKKGQSIVIERREDAGYYFVRELLDDQMWHEYGTIINDVELSMDIDGFGTMGEKMYHTRDTAIMNFKADSARVKFVNRLVHEAGIVEIQKTTNLGDDDGSYDFEVRLDGEALPVGTKYELLPIQVDTNSGTKGETKTVETEGIVTVPNGQKAVIWHVLYGTKVEIKETSESQEGFRPVYELYVDGEKKSDGTADSGYVTWTLLRNAEAMAEGTDGMQVVLKCRNVKDGDLPNAGGAGTTAFLLIGLTAMGAAALGLAMMKKKRR